MITNAWQQAQLFIASDQFFEWHGVGLASLWFVGAIIAILARRLSLNLHALCFFLVDAFTMFFLAGAWIRVYP